MRKVAGGVTSNYYYVGGKLYYEKRGAKELYYFYDSIGNLAMIQYYTGSGEESYNYYVATNSRGDVEAIYRGNGTIKARYIYDTWGKVISVVNENGQEITSQNDIGLINPIRYRGYYYDQETGYYYLQSRYYDPDTGRFLNGDGQVVTGLGINRHNMYSYCENNPIMNIDPTGEFSLKNLFVGIGVTVAVVGAVAAVSALTVATAGVGTAALAGGLTATLGTTGMMGIAGAGAGLMASGTILAVGSAIAIPDNIQLKENIRDTGLINISDAELAELLKKATGKDKLRYQKEQKARKTRNKQKRESHYTLVPDVINKKSSSKPQLRDGCVCGHHFTIYTETGFLLC